MWDAVCVVHEIMCDFCLVPCMVYVLQTCLDGVIIISVKYGYEAKVQNFK
jgi:hypothetical protein